jgi:thiamine-phosphate pyrophosphorylase
MNISDLAHTLKRRGGLKKLPHLILMSDERRLADPLPLAARLGRGAAVCLRHYHDPARADLARELKKLCRERDLLLFIGGDMDLARSVGADGLHLPEDLARRNPAWPRRWRDRPGRLVTVAAHSPGALFRAARIGADAALLGPVFATPSHPGAPVIGAVRFAAWCALAPLPVYGLGGLDRLTARRIRQTRAIGCAGIGGMA